MKAALRLGLIYWAVLLLVFALGHRNQVEKAVSYTHLTLPTKA